MELSIGIITRNRKNMLKRCLSSVYKEIQGIDMEVIVIDNNSNDDTPDMIRTEFKDVILIENRDNMGVARGRNQIIERYLGKYLLILDDDTKILSSNFKDLILYMENDKNIGVVGCCILTPGNEVYPSARSFPRPVDIFLNRLSFLPFVKLKVLPEGYQHALKKDQSPMTVDFVMGAFQLISRFAQQTTGLLDKKMKYGFEDADFCANMIKLGFYTVYYPNFKIIHYKGTVSESMLSKYTLYFIKSYLRFYQKHRDIIKKQHVKAKRVLR